MNGTKKVLYWFVKCGDVSFSTGCGFVPVNKTSYMIKTVCDVLGLKLYGNHRSSRVSGRLYVGYA